MSRFRFTAITIFFLGACNDPVELPGPVEHPLLPGATETGRPLDEPSVPTPLGAAVPCASAVAVVLDDEVLEEGACTTSGDAHHFTTTCAPASDLVTYQTEVRVDAAGRVVDWITRPAPGAGVGYHYGYDGQGRLERVAVDRDLDGDDDWEQQITARDAAGLPMAATVHGDDAEIAGKLLSGTGNTLVAYTHDEHGRLRSRELKLASSGVVWATETITYDDPGRRRYREVTLAGAGGSYRGHERFDAGNQLIEVSFTTPLGSTVEQHDYDDAGRVEASRMSTRRPGVWRTPVVEMYPRYDCK